MYAHTHAPMQGLYFSFVTLTTVGYGDITPTANVAAIYWYMAYSVVGLGCLTWSVGVLWDLKAHDTDDLHKSDETEILTGELNGLEQVVWADPLAAMPVAIHCWPTK